MSLPDGIPLDIKGRFQHYHVGPIIYLPNDGRGQGGTGGFPLLYFFQDIVIIRYGSIVCSRH
jgi:hypothetical protein